MICPSCKGAGESRGIACGPGGCDLRAFKCFTCKGAREITDEHAARIEYGRLMSQDRIRRRLTVREEAARLGCGLGEWSRIEHGDEPETEEGRRALASRREERLQPPPEHLEPTHAYRAPADWPGALCVDCGRTSTAAIHATVATT
jgi:hypothetical protein